MSDAYVQIIPDSTGKKIDNTLLTVGANQVYRQRVEVYSGETLPVSGPVTDAQIRATALPVSGPLTNTELRASTVPVSSASDTVLGTTADAAVSTDTTGTISGKLRGLVKIMSNVWNSTTSRLKVEQPSMSMTASGFSRVAALTTLFDGKILGAEDTIQWSTKGTGTAAFASNGVNMSVTSGQYLVRQAQHWNPYYSGKPQLIEVTQINFQYQTGVVKRFGYFSSSATAPYTANFDGFYVESDGVNNTYRLVFVRDGTETHNIPWTSWDNYSLVSGYDWSKFTVSEVDFLWLGGAAARLFMVVNGSFTLIHTIDDHAGTQADLIMLSPNQPIRYEIRGVSASGSMKAICSQVASEGGAVEEGEELSVYSAAIACNVVGTIYAIKGVRKSATYRNIYVELQRTALSIVAGATADTGILLVFLNPTLSAPLTWAANSRIEEGTATTQTITAGSGRLLAAIPMNTSGNAATSVGGGLKALLIDLDNVAGQIILAYQPTTTTQNLIGSISVVEY